MTLTLTMSYLLVVNLAPHCGDDRAPRTRADAAPIRSASIDRSWTLTQSPSGFRHTVSPARFTTWMPNSAAPTGWRLQTSRQATVTRLAASIVKWCHSKEFAIRVGAAEFGIHVVNLAGETVW